MEIFLSTFTDTGVSDSTLNCWFRQKSLVIFHGRSSVFRTQYNTRVIPEVADLTYRQRLLILKNYYGRKNQPYKV